MSRSSLSASFVARWPSKERLLESCAESLMFSSELFSPSLLVSNALHLLLLSSVSTQRPRGGGELFLLPGASPDLAEEGRNHVVDLSELGFGGANFLMPSLNPKRRLDDLSSSSKGTVKAIELPVDGCSPEAGHVLGRSGDRSADEQAVPSAGLAAEDGREVASRSGDSLLSISGDRSLASSAGDEGVRSVASSLGNAACRTQGAVGSGFQDSVLGGLGGLGRTSRTVLRDSSSVLLRSSRESASWRRAGPSPQGEHGEGGSPVPRGGEARRIRGGGMGSSCTSGVAPAGDGVHGLCWRGEGGGHREGEAAGEGDVR